MRYYIGYGRDDDNNWCWYTEKIVTSEKHAELILHRMAVNWWIKNHSRNVPFPELRLYFQENNKKYYDFKIKYNYWDYHVVFSIVQESQ